MSLIKHQAHILHSMWMFFKETFTQQILSIAGDKRQNLGLGQYIQDIPTCNNVILMVFLESFMNIINFKGVTHNLQKNHVYGPAASDTSLSIIIA